MAPSTEMEIRSYPGARRPDRTRRIDSSGLALSVAEWGDPAAPPLLVAHGGFDFARTFDVFAPLLADAGWRVVAWDQRGHGDSEHAALYSWPADVRDALAVLDSTSDEAIPFVAHSKAGGLLTDLAEAHPGRCRALVNLEGLPSSHRHRDVADHERAERFEAEVGGWLEHRQRIAGLVRRPGTIRELARRRARMNPRLSLEWLEYLVGVGAREDEDGWRWKIDPSLRMGGFGPWHPRYSLERLRSFPVPLLGIVGTMPEEMGWGSSPDELRACLPAGARLEVFDDAGHFVHIEKPREVADLVLEFLA